MGVESSCDVDAIAVTAGPGLATALQVGIGAVKAYALALGVLCKETHRRTVRIAPPLVIEPAEIDRGVAALAEALH